MAGEHLNRTRDQVVRPTCKAKSKRGETAAANSELRYGYMEEGEESERVSGTCFLV